MTRRGKGNRQPVVRSRFGAAGAVWLVLLSLAAASLVSLVSQPAKAAEHAQVRGQSCELALILAIDASSSVYTEEYNLQQKGTASALLDPEVSDAIIALGGMNLFAFEWSGRYNQEVILDWVRIETHTDIARAALTIGRHRRVHSQFPTAMGYALGYASGQFSRAPDFCLRKVIDVAGDGIQNEGFGPQIAYENFPFSDIVVNGLVIKGAQPDPEAFYRNEVIHGPGAFLVVAADFRDYARAMKVKLLKEVGQRSLSLR